MAVGPCCQPQDEEQPENEVTDEMRADLDAEEERIFGKPVTSERTKINREVA